LARHSQKRPVELRLEKWHSTENRHEEHYFLEGGEFAGYQKSAYVFGYNPEIVTPEKVARILQIIQEPRTEDSDE